MILQPKCHRKICDELSRCFFRHLIVSNTPALCLKISLPVITEGKLCQTIHIATVPATVLASILEHLIISPEILKEDALHEAEFALASQVEEGSGHMPLAWVAAEELLGAELPSRGGPFISVAVAGVQAGLVTAAEVAESLWVFGETNEDSQIAIEVCPACERQHPLAALCPH